jgi:hypothetical protein
LGPSLVAYSTPGDIYLMKIVKKDEKFSKLELVERLNFSSFLMVFAERKLVYFENNALSVINAKNKQKR